MKTRFIFWDILVFSIAVYSQSITNTLGTGGVFSIKDAATTFFYLRQSDGYIGIGTTSPGAMLTLSGNDALINGLTLGKGTSNIFTNTTFGYHSLLSNTTGYHNLALGYNSLFSNQTGNFNTSGGTYSLEDNNMGDLNTAFGYSSLANNTSGSNNTALGSITLVSNTTGAGNTTVGFGGLWSNAGNHGSTAIGYDAMYYADNRITGRMTYNTAVGYSSLRGSTNATDNTGQYNTAIGSYSLTSNATGYMNTASGSYALFSNTTGNYNTANGSYALFSNTTGNNNIANGYNALYFNTTGYDNTAIGYYALGNNTTGSNNTANGLNALYSNTTGYNNTAVGYSSLDSNTSGYQNSSLGALSLYSNTTGNYNTAVGNNAGYNVTTGSNLLCLGYNAQPTSGSATNQITLGNVAITSLRCNVTTITSLSDARDKKNIKDLDLGIDFLMKIKPRLFNWDKREWYGNNISDGSKMKEEPTAGFIAQELDEAQTTENAEWLNLVLKDNPEKWEATPGNLLPIMVKAIQDLNLKSEELKAEKDIEIARLKSENEELKNNAIKLLAEVESLKVMSEKLVALEQMVNELISEKHAALVTKN